MFVTRHPLRHTMRLSVILLLFLSSVDSLPKTQRLNTIDRDICYQNRNGKISTGFAKSPDELYIFKSRIWYYWSLDMEFKNLTQRMASEIEELWFKFNLVDFDMAFALTIEGWFGFNTIITYFLEVEENNINWYNYSEVQMGRDSHGSGTFTDPRLINSSVVFKLNSVKDKVLLLFISQRNINDSYNERQYSVYELLDPKDIKSLLKVIKSVPQFILGINSKYWIIAILEIDTNSGIIFLEYNNTGVHCYFNGNVSSCGDKEVVPNIRLFGCRDPEPIPEFKIDEISSTTIGMPSYGFLDHLFGEIYKTFIIILVLITLIIFVCLPFILLLKGCLLKQVEE